jgi:lipopolysaccharide transport system permease protein
MGEEREFVIEASRQNRISIKEMWGYRELFYFFSIRDIKVKYKQTLFGIAWVVLQPVLTALIFSIFFGGTINVQSTGLPYPVFVFSGLLLWNAFSSGVNSAANSMISHAAIIKKIYFPRLIIPVSAVIVSFVDFIVTFGVFMLVIFFYDVDLDILLAVIFWPLSIVAMLTGLIGLSSGLAALTLKYRDFRYIVPFALQIALFLSPVIYPISILQNQNLHYLLALNPMYASITLFRYPLIGGHIDILQLSISVAAAIILFFGGVYYFKKTEAYFADIA